MCEIRPALQFESLLETMFALAADGKTNRKGMPNLLRLAVIANAHFDTVQLPFPPAILQRIGLALGAPLGRLSRLRRRSTCPAARDRRGRRMKRLRRRLFIAARVVLAARARARSASRSTPAAGPHRPT